MPVTFWFRSQRMADSNFEEVIKEDRAARESTRWQGTLLKYLEWSKRIRS